LLIFRTLSDLEKACLNPRMNNLLTKQPLNNHPVVLVQVSHLVVHGTLGRHQNRSVTMADLILSLACSSVMQPMWGGHHGEIRTLLSLLHRLFIYMPVYTLHILCVSLCIAYMCI
jgi:hypothetical protein